MKKITSFIVMLALMLVSTPIFADDFLPELKSKVFTLGAPVEEIETDTWYLMYQCRGGGGYLFDPGSGDQLLKGPLSDIKDEGENVAQDLAKYLVRFSEGTSSSKECEYNTYYIQFGTGRWIAEGVKGSYPVTADEKTDACCFNIGQMSQTEKGHFWWTLDYLQDRLDNNDFSGTTATVVYWDSGISTSVNGNCDWRVYSIDLKQGDEYQMLYDKVYERYTTLMNYYDSFDPGTGYGQYDSTKVAAFQKILDDVGEAFETETQETLTKERLQKMLDDMNNAYDAVCKSQVRLGDGYYFLKNGIGDDYFYLTEEGSEEKTYVAKAIYNNSKSTGWTTFYRATADLSFLFRVDYDEETGYFKFYNVATGGRMPQIYYWNSSFDFDATLDPVESEVELTFAQADEAGNPAYYIRRADQLLDTWASYEYVIPNGINSGAGVSGTLMAWSSTITPSGRASWIFLPVSEQEVDQLIEEYKSVREHEALVARYDSLVKLSKTEMAIAKEYSNLVTSASQFSSPWTEPSEGAIEYLVDGDYSTYWHSNWSDGQTEMNKHYLQVDLGDPIEDGLTMTYVRRNNSNNQVTELILKGTNTPNDEESWAELGQFSFPSEDMGVELTAGPVTFEGAYQYFRIYPKTTIGSAESMVGYWHAAEINFLPAAPDPNAQAYKMGDAFTNLEEFINNHEGITEDQITTKVCDSLQSYVDAFHAKFVDPTPLRTAIKIAKKNVTYVVEGNDPGCWSDLSTKTSLEGVITDAAAYNAAGNYTQTQSDTYTKNLTDGTTAMMAAANKIGIDKWYQIQFPSEELYDTYGWAKSGAALDEDGGLIRMEQLFDKVVTLGKTVVGDGSTTSAYYEFPEVIGSDEGYQGTLIVADDAADLNNVEFSYFRFVEVGDAYALQNKATGLYIKMTGESANTYADIQPTLFKVSPIGTGANILKADGVDSTDYAYLHLQHDGSKIVSWDASALGSNSAFLIKTVEDLTEVPDNKFTKAVEEGKVYPMCYAASFKVTGEGAKIYTVKGIRSNSEKMSVVLTPTQEAAAGQPVIVVADGDYEEPEGEPQYTEVEMEHGTSFATQPLTANCIYGTYVPATAPVDAIVAKGGGFTVLTKAADIECNGAYIVNEGETVEVAEGDLEIEVDGGVVAINDVINKVAATSAIYSIDGRLVKNGNINTLQQLGKGMYIVNGVKVLVK